MSDFFFVPFFDPQACNFMFVSPTYRMVYLSLAAFAWLNILCFAKNFESYFEVSAAPSDKEEESGGSA